MIKNRVVLKVICLISVPVFIEKESQVIISMSCFIRKIDEFF